MFDKIKPVFNIDEETKRLLKDIDIKLNNLKINDNQKKKKYGYKIKSKINTFITCNRDKFLVTIWC